MHSLAHDSGHFAVGSGIMFVHCVQNTSLNRLEAIHDIRDGSLENHVGRVVEEPVLEHARQLVFLAVTSQEFLVFVRWSRRRVVNRLFIQVLIIIQLVLRQLVIVKFFHKV